MNKTIFLSALLLLAAFVRSAADELPLWRDVHATQVNREPARTDFMSYPDRTIAASFNYAKSPYYKLLNGVWKFYFVNSYKELPANITDADASTASWKDIRVPGNWEMQGFGTAIYVNQPYEFQPTNPTPPLLPDENPTG